MATAKIKIFEAKGIEKCTALSYCWGADSPMQLLRSTITAWKEVLPLDDLPQTIKDAILTTRRSGLKYFWVETALMCIKKAL